MFFSLFLPIFSASIWCDEFRLQCNLDRPDMFTVKTIQRMPKDAQEIFISGLEHEKDPNAALNTILSAIRTMVDEEKMPLRILDIKLKKMEVLPEVLWSFSNLKSLTISSDHWFTQVPYDICRLRNLKYLAFYCEQLNTLSVPFNIANRTGLKIDKELEPPITLEGKEAKSALYTLVYNQSSYLWQELERKIEKVVIQ